MEKYIIKLIGFISGLILIFTCLAFTAEICNSINYPFKFSKEGISNFLYIFDNTIKSFIAFLAILTLYVATRKLSVSISQTDAIFENNKFNNYFKHREYFNTQLSKSTMISSFSKSSQIDTIYNISFTYNYFYRSNYTDFVPKIKPSAHAIMKKYIDVMEILIYNRNKSIPTPSSVDLSIIEDLFDEHQSIIEERVKHIILDQLDSIQKYWNHEIKNKNQFASDPKQAKYEFELFSIFYWTLSLFNDVLLFDSSDKIEMKGINDIYEAILSKNGL